MTNPRRPARPRRRARSAPKIRPSVALAMLVVLGLFIAGLAAGGHVGATIVGLLTAAAGIWLIFRWQALDPRVRIFRAAVVAAGLAVAISLFYR